MLTRILFCLILITCCQSGFAGPLFQVSSTGQPAAITFVLCLNGKGALSCQTYTASAINLSIVTTIANHQYPDAGIKILTPGYTPTGCSMNANGYCLFPVNHTDAANIPVKPPVCPPDIVMFSPANTYLNNPVSGPSNPTQQFTINMTMCNSAGQLLTPTAENPIHVEVYGAPAGVISPTSTTTSTGYVTFTYSGAAFPNNISINAWIADSSNHGAALGVTEVLQQNTPACTLGSTSYTVPMTSGLPNALQVNADVGYDISAANSSFTTYTIDTGSLGVVVPTSELPHNANVIGPGAPGIKYYDSSGNTYAGHYYLAPVRLKLASGAVITQPIMVLGIDKAYCTGPSSKPCHTSPPTPNLHYLGVGFNRNSTTDGDLFNSPTANAFLHITNSVQGTDMTPGYVLSPAVSLPTALTLGITSTSGFNTVNLTANPDVPGDFNAQSGCYSFPDSPSPNQFCGTALLDVGIDYMFIDLPRAEWPAGTHDTNHLVPAGTNMSILMGSVAAPAMSYDFTAVQSNPPAGSPTPAKVQWIDSTKTGQIFVNTGRNPLYSFNYLYNGQCGQVGFYPLP